MPAPGPGWEPVLPALRHPVLLSAAAVSAAARLPAAATVVSTAAGIPAPAGWLSCTPAATPAAPAAAAATVPRSARARLSAAAAGLSPARVRRRKHQRVDRARRKLRARGREPPARAVDPGRVGRDGLDVGERRAAV